MYSYLYAIIGLSLFQILYPILLMTVFKKRWFHIDNENGALSKREVRNKMGKREYIFALPISLAIFIINVVLFAYFVCTSQVKITLDEPEKFAISFVVLLIIFALITSGIDGGYLEARSDELGPPMKFIGKPPVYGISGLITELENWKKWKWFNREGSKNSAIPFYSLFIFCNSFILVPILLLY